MSSPVSPSTQFSCSPNQSKNTFPILASFNLFLDTNPGMFQVESVFPYLGLIHPRQKHPIQLNPCSIFSWHPSWREHWSHRDLRWHHFQVSSWTDWKWCQSRSGMRPTSPGNTTHLAVVQGKKDALVRGLPLRTAHLKRNLMGAQVYSGSPPCCPGGVGAVQV